MIASLTGLVEKASPGQLILNVGGVGYLVHVPMSTFVRLPPVGETARVSTVTIVREDEISLYGFATDAEQWLFTLLQEVTGVGPKLALKILSGIEPQKLRDALAGRDTAMLTSISGVGKKLAERLVLELKDKVGQIQGIEQVGPSTQVSTPVAQEAAEALTALGYPLRVAKKAVEAAFTESMSVEETVRQALKLLAPKR